MNLVGFNGETVQVIGKVTLPIETHGVTIYSKMIIIDANSTYNVVLERPWLHHMKVIHSSYHQMITFSVFEKIEKIRNGQVYTRSCFVSTMKRKTYEDK